MHEKTFFSHVALIGFGRIAEILYAPYLRHRFASVTVCEPNPERHAAIRSLVPDATIVGSIEELGTAPDGVSVALNLVPAPSHAETTRRLLRQRWHVFSEKPAASSPDEWRSLLGEASIVSRVFVSAPVTPYLPSVERLLRAVRERALGEIGEIHATFFAAGPARRGYIDESRRWFFGPDSCVVRDLAPYAVSALVRVAGAPSEFTWHRNAVCKAIEVRPGGEIIPSFGNAAVGVGRWRKAVVSVAVAYRPEMTGTDARLTLRGSAGTLDCSLDEPPIADVHPQAKVELAFTMAQRAITDRAFRMRHSYDVAQTLAIVHSTTAAQAIAPGAQASSSAS